MAILRIRLYGDPILRAPTKPVDEVTDETRKLIQDMMETMRKADGVGLAAPQVGVSKSIIVARNPENASLPTGQAGEIALINPEILESEGEIVAEEGCLSFPKITSEVRRTRRIIVEGLNPQGEKIRVEEVDLMARIIQHEIDHLKGILFIDRMSPARKILISKELKRLIKLRGRT